MITDRIGNIRDYDVPQEVINFVWNLTPKIQPGKYIIGNNIYANVEKYSTKSVEKCRFEAHRDYIDIQILLQGQEDIYYTDVEGLNISEPYNADKDIEFYSDSIVGTPKVTLNGTNFMLIKPGEAHAPQAGDRQKVLKVVVKIKV